MDILVNLLVRHYGLEWGCASHFEAVSARRILQQHREVHTPLFEAFPRIVVKPLEQANLNWFNVRGTSTKSKRQPIDFHIEERIIEN